jgi:hypothetical protein
MAGLVGWEEGWFGQIGRGPVWFRQEEGWFGLDGKSSGIYRLDGEGFVREEVWLYSCVAGFR